MVNSHTYWAKFCVMNDIANVGLPLKCCQQLLKLIRGVHAVFRDLLRSCTFWVFASWDWRVSDLGAWLVVHLGKLKSEGFIRLIHIQTFGIKIKDYLLQMKMKQKSNFILA